MNIAICGLLRSGKNAAADYLRDQYGYTQFAFGDELKRYAHELFDVPRGTSEPKPRELYQTFGQWCRQRDPDIWVRKCFAAIDESRRHKFERFAKLGLATPSFRAVICDLRQPNEEARCRAEGYVIIRVNAPDEIRIARARAAGDSFKAADLAHETESHVANFAVDYEIENAGTLGELHAAINVIMADFSEASA